MSSERVGEVIKRALGAVLPGPQVVVMPANSTGGNDPGRLTEDELASIAVRLALSFPEWVERRVEHIVYLDDTTVRLRESVTLRWPEPEFFVEDARPKSGQTIYVPLDILKKRPLIEVDVAKPDGSSFPILSTRRNGEIAASGLTSAIWYVSENNRGGRGLEDASLDLIEAAVKAPASQGSELLKVLDDPTTELGQVLKEPDEVRGLLRELGSNFMLLAPATYKPGAETVLKYSYSERLPWKLSLRNLAATFGLADFRSELVRLGLGYGESYHVEVDAPEEVRLARARLFGSYVASSGTDRVYVAIAEDGDNPVVDLHGKRPTAATLRLAEEYKAKPWWKRAVQRKPGAAPLPKDPRAAADASTRTQVARSDRGFAEIAFRPRISGSFIAAVITSVLTSALLIGVRDRLPQLDGGVGSAVLLALPVLAAGYLTRSGEHAFATRLLAGVRFSTLVVGICSLAVAAVLGGGFIDTAQRAPARLTCAAAKPSQRLARSTELRCVADRQAPPKKTVPRDVRRVVDGATITASALSVILLLGLLRTWLWPTVRLPKDHDDDDVI